MLTIAKDLQLPLDTLTSRIAVVGVSGSGKTYTFSVFAEEMLKVGGHVAIIDPLGVAWGLRAVLDNATEPPLPLYILGGDKADLPLDPGAGAAIAEIVVQERLSVVLDLSHFDDDQQRALFVADFATRLLAINREPLHVFVDEADLFAPQRPSTKEEFTCRKAMDNLVRRGRVKGVGVTLVSQRPAVVAKNLLTQITTLVAHQLTGQSDRQAVDAWVKANGGDEQRKAVLDSLAGLAAGEAWVWKPGAGGVFARVRIRARQTFDSSATPVFGQTPIEPKRLDAPDLSALRDKLAALFETATSDDPALLQEQIADLKRQLKERPTETVTVEKPIEKIVEVPVLSEPLAAQLQDLMDSAASTIKEMEAVRDALRATLTHFGKGTASEDAPPSALPTDASTEPEAAAPPPAQPPRTTAPKAKPATGVALPPAQQKMLDALAEFAALGLTEVHRDNVAVWAGVSPKSSQTDSHLRQLREQGYITTPGQGLVYLCKKGADVAAPVSRPATAAELLARWKAKLPAKQGAILEALVRVYPGEAARATVAAQSGQSVTSSAFDAHCRALRDLGLLIYPNQGQLKATARLMLK